MATLGLVGAAAGFHPGFAAKTACLATNKKGQFCLRRPLVNCARCKWHQEQVIDWDAIPPENPHTGLPYTLPELKAMEVHGPIVQSAADRRPPQKSSNRQTGTLLGVRIICGAENTHGCYCTRTVKQGKVRCYAHNGVGAGPVDTTFFTRTDVENLLNAGLKNWRILDDPTRFSDPNNIHILPPHTKNSPFKSRYPDRRPSRGRSPSFPTLRPGRPRSPSSPSLGPRTPGSPARRPSRPRSLGSPARRSRGSRRLVRRRGFSSYDPSYF